MARNLFRSPTKRLVQGILRKYKFKATSPRPLNRSLSSPKKYRSINEPYRRSASLRTVSQIRFDAKHEIIAAGAVAQVRYGAEREQISLLSAVSQMPVGKPVSLDGFESCCGQHSEDLMLGIEAQKVMDYQANLVEFLDESLSPSYEEFSTYLNYLFKHENVADTHKIFNILYERLRSQYDVQFIWMCKEYHQKHFQTDSC